MKEISMDARKRPETGKNAARRLRMRGQVPAVLYGAGIDGAVPIALPASHLYRVLHTAAGENVIITLNIEGEKEPRMVMFKEIDLDPVKETVEHVDLMAVVFGKKMTVEVPVHITGKAEGQKQGGILQHGVRKLTVECVPRAIPDAVNVDVSGLNIGDSIHVKDIKLPEGVRIVDDPETTIVTVAPPVVEAEVKTPEEAEEELARSFEEKEGAEETGEAG